MIPILVAAGVLYGAYRVTNAVLLKGSMTAERRAIYEAAMTRTPGLPPDKLLALASEFDTQGLPIYAEKLRKRALLRSLPDDVKSARQNAIKKAMTSQDANGVRLVAQACDAEGMYSSAEKLREYAEALDNQEMVDALTPPTPGAANSPPYPLTPAPNPTIDQSTATPASTVAPSAGAPMPTDTVDSSGVQASSPDQQTPTPDTSGNITTGDLSNATGQPNVADFHL